MLETVQFRLNGKSVDMRVDGDRMLLWVLRTDLNLTGTKCGCSEGWCGACTVLVNDEAVLSCKTPVRDVADAKIVTIEGFGSEASLHPLQKAFAGNDALQCGFCTPGMILKAYGLLAENPGLSRNEIIDGMEGNLCRCGSHTRILDAIETAAGEMKGGAR